MTKTTTLLLTAFALVTAHAVGATQTKPNPAVSSSVQPAQGIATKAGSEEPQNTVFTGRVTAVDAKAGKVTVKANDKEIKLTAESANTKAAVARLKVGDTARVFARDGKVIAISSVKAERKAGSPKE